MTLNEYFDEIFCINLDSRPDRWQRCQEIFASHGLRVTRISAFDGYQIPNPHRLKPGEVGCTASHLFVLGEIAQRCHRGLVLEDDVEFVSHLQQRFHDLQPEIPLDWEMFYFGGNHIETPHRMTQGMSRISMTYSTCCYGITGAIAAQFRNEIVTGRDIIDVAYADRHRHYRCYATTPSLAWQRAGMSDIQNAWMDYSFMKPND